MCKHKKPENLEKSEKKEIPANGRSPAIAASTLRSDNRASNGTLRAYPNNLSSARYRASRLWARKAKQAMYSIADAA